jgi:pyridoxamine 5'-phosphate oxidase
MKQNPNVSLNFFWPSLERQIRIEGTVQLSDSSFSDDYFNNRPRESKIGSWSSPQSQVITNRAVLENEYESLKKRFEGQEVPRPDFWGGWLMTSHYYEFWQGRKSRLHDRLTYTLKNNNWEISRLAP